MEVAINKLMHFFKASPSSDVTTLDGKLGFIKTYWELEKLALLRVPEAVQSAIYLGLPFNQYEWGGILPMMPGPIIRLIPDKYPSEGLPPSSVLSEMAGYGNTDGISAYLDVFPHESIMAVDFTIAMSKAMRFGHDGCVEILKHYCTPNPDDFRKAAAFGHKAVVAETIEYMTASDVPPALCDAARFGHTGTVSVILQSCPIDDVFINKAYYNAKSYGHKETMDVINEYRN